jgi:general secretion pathway protein A
MFEAYHGSSGIKDPARHKTGDKRRKQALFGGHTLTTRALALNLGAQIFIRTVSGMYKAFYGLSDNPFSIAPNPHYLFLSDRHREALAHLTYGLGETGGFVLLTGEVGTGKTTVSRCLLNKLPDNTDTAFILNPALTELELLATLCDELKIDYGDAPSLKQLTDKLSQYLLANHEKGRNTVLIIDEAQHLRPAVLEQLRLLTNLETDTKKLLQVILIGQPELQQLLRRQELRQLAQRITARYHLLPLTKEEIALYVQHRLQVAGRFEPLFTHRAIGALHKYSSGIPRLINLLSERALMAGYAQSRVPIDHKMVARAAAEVLGEEEPKRHYLWPSAIALSCALAFGGTLLYLQQSAGVGKTEESAQPEAVTQTTTASQTQAANQPLPVAAATAASGIEAGAAEGTNASASLPLNPRELDPQESASRLLANAIAQSRNIDTAFAGLFGLWGKTPYIGLSACQAAKVQGLICHQQQGNWSSLQELNYPAVVYLGDEQRREFYATLVAVDDEQLLLQLAEQQLWVSRDWFTQHFTGTFELLWQPPGEVPREIGLNASPGDIQWLENSLARVEGTSPRKISEFDPQLLQKLKAFQHRHGLKADGIVGSQTWMQLNLYLSQQGPRLVGTDLAGPGSHY